MASLLTGTITFLFTDVEGSTRLWETHPQAMRAVMARHDALLTAAFEEHDGAVVRPRGEGDSLFAVFVRASDAVAGALAGQRAMAAEEWGVVGALRVRMGLHTGEADLREGDYYGSAVNRCARIRAAGHGGQVLLSQTTADLVRGNLPPGAALLDLGRHGLKDLTEAQALYQLTVPDLPDAFPPLKTLANRPHNLPLQLTSFVGRERELADIVRSLGEARLLTLTGPGGTGKTRLALQAAAEALDSFPDGAFFVDLAPLSDPALVPAAVARVLGVQEVANVPLQESIARFLRDKRLLLLLDNYEHLLAAAGFVGTLVQATAAVSVLVTSRAPLRLSGEREYPVPPLPLPPEQALTAPGAAANPAVALFVARARDVRPDFALSAENTAAVAAVCRRLDGLPLAIELAAARVRVLPPAALLARLDQRLPLLSGGRRDAPARQQTLRATIAWSYALLEPAEQRLFRRLGVFAGGCTLELAEAVCNATGDLGLDVLEGVSSLVEKSLLRETDTPGGEPRYSMLETIREFALERLVEAGETEALAQRHAAAFVAVAEEAGEALLSPGWAVAHRWLESERHNLRAVHIWAVAHQDADTALRLVGVQWRWLHTYGGEDITTGKTWTKQALDLPGADAPTSARAAALRTFGLMLQIAGDIRAAGAALRESADLFRALDRRRDLGMTLTLLASNYPASLLTAAELLEESLALAEETGNLYGCGFALFHQAVHARQRGEFVRARAAAEACLVVAQRLTEPHMVFNAWFALAAVAIEQGDPQAGEYTAQALDAAPRWGVARARHPGALSFAGLQALLAGQHGEAIADVVEGLRTAEASGLRNGLDILLLEVLACAWTAQGQMLEQATRLLGAASHLHHERAAGHFKRFATLLEQTVSALRGALGEAAFAQAYEAGCGLTRDEAIAEALALAAAPLRGERAAAP